ncbi:hypothetical protein EDD29_9082 [Actinocorallia herbida]|uniref:Uncharacterized protein n=1 Tax=Actinocorallia herbida TaxID=58109 RepID=A0A3N1DDS5_9ACTN|nr:hypothetical protein [Actinocorallia herbida]ROO91328.1 hypothetical protein EDD29_9082 [Actinocorallia herbida]
MTHEERQANHDHRGPSWWHEQKAKARLRRAESMRVLDAELDQRMPARYRKRRTRRALAVAGGACLALLWADAAASWVLAPSDTAMIVNFVILGVLLVAGFPLGGALIALTRGMTSRPERELDERERTARLRAFSTAHRCTTVVMAVALVVTMFANEGRDSRIPAAALFLILFALLGTHALLPLVVATWQAPDPLVDEDEDGDGFGDGDGDSPDAPPLPG